LFYALTQPIEVKFEIQELQVIQTIFNMESQGQIFERVHVETLVVIFHIPEQSFFVA
jgi:hypothetical protein